MFINIVLFLIHVDKFDENVQADLDCSSQENTDSDSDGEIEVLHTTVTKEQPKAPNTDRIKSLARLFEEAWRATEKPAKKTVPKEEGNRP